MKTVALADVLWDAANEFLWEGQPGGYGSSFSCWAIERAALKHGCRQQAMDAFLAPFGVDPSAPAFGGVKHGPKRQGVRYMWLLLAACVAEDEGITVEVA